MLYFRVTLSKKDMILIGSNMIVLRVRGENRGKAKKLSDLYRFRCQRGNLFKEKRGTEFLPG